MAINNWTDYKIIIDEPAKDVPDFREHAEWLSKIIVSSKSQFTVGIFGRWGTGKTTMMQSHHPNKPKSQVHNNDVVV